MKKLKNIMLGILIFATISIVVVCSIYNYNLKPPKNSKDVIEIEIPNGSSVKKVASILKSNNLIRSEKIFVIYTKIMNKSNLKSGIYKVSYNTGVKKLVDTLEKGSTYNPEEVVITFKEGKTMRDIAKVIEANTNNSYDSVIEKSNDIEYIDSLIEKYWFITEEVKQDGIYYKLEGYLFPDTYAFKNKDVSVEEIFNKMIAEMAKKLEPYKKEINKSNLSIHEILTLASMIEKESYDSEEDRKNVAERGIKDEDIGENFDIMEGIARRIPLSRLARPSWDRCVLGEIGFEVETDEQIWTRVWTDEEKLNFASTPLFLIRAARNV